MRSQKKYCAHKTNNALAEEIKRQRAGASLALKVRIMVMTAAGIYKGRLGKPDNSHPLQQ